MNSRLGDGFYKKRLLWEVSSVQIQAVTSCLYEVRAATYADRWDGLPASLPAAACGKATVKMNSRLGGGQPPGLKSADRAKRGIYLTASR